MFVARRGLALVFGCLLFGSGLQGGIADSQCQEPGCVDLDPSSLLQARSREGATPQNDAFPRPKKPRPKKSQRLKESAIVVIDMQNDFADKNGTLGFGGMHMKLLDPINKLLDLDWGLRVFTADNHPHNHVSFSRDYPSYDKIIANGGFDIVRVNYSKVTANQNAKICGAEYIERYGEAADVCRPVPSPSGQMFESEGTVLQETYPPHCVQGTWGQKILSGLKFSYTDPDDHLLLKGQNAHIDSYSAIFNNLACIGDGVVRKNANGNIMSSLCIPKGPIYPQETALPDLLRVSKVKHVYFVGLCKDYCVKYSSIHSAMLGKQYGWETHLITDAAEFCNPSQFHKDEAMDQMRDQGVQMVKSGSLMP